MPRGNYTAPPEVWLALGIVEQAVEDSKALAAGRCPSYLRSLTTEYMGKADDGRDLVRVNRKLEKRVRKAVALELLEFTRSVWIEVLCDAVGPVAEMARGKIDAGAVQGYELCDLTEFSKFTIMGAE